MKYSVLILALIFVWACSEPSDPNYDALYEEIQQADIKSAVATANRWRTENPDIVSMISHEELTVIFPDSRKVIKSLAENETYIAVAPYEKNTHSCEIHYISSCQGELQDTDFQCRVIDKNGNEVWNSTVRSLPNGFFELWLPRNSEFDITVSRGALQGAETIGTRSNDRTCITTIMLK